MTAAITLVLVAPGLLGLPDEFLGAQESFARLARYAPPAQREPRGIERALTAVLALPSGEGSAPFAARGAGVVAHRVSSTPLAHADPVHLEAGEADVVLAARVADLSPDESAALVASLNVHFADDGLRLIEARPDAWFLAAESTAGDPTHGPALVATADVPSPDSLAGRSLSLGLPADRAARPWLRWQAECEMLLHAHPINAARAERHAATVDALWLWGGGRLAAAAAALPALIAYLPPGRDSDFVAGVASLAHGSAPPWAGTAAGVGPLFDALDAASTRGSDASSAGTVVAVAAVEPIGSEAQALGFARGWLAPSLARLEAHTVVELIVVADGRHGAAIWRARSPGLMARLHARLRRKRFEVPAGASGRATPP